MITAVLPEHLDDCPRIMTQEYQYTLIQIADDFDDYGDAKVLEFVR